MEKLAYILDCKETDYRNQYCEKAVSPSKQNVGKSTKQV